MPTNTNARGPNAAAAAGSPRLEAASATSKPRVAAAAGFPRLETASAMSEAVVHERFQPREGRRVLFHLAQDHEQRRSAPRVAEGRRFRGPGPSTLLTNERSHLSETETN